MSASPPGTHRGLCAARRSGPVPERRRAIPSPLSSSCRPILTNTSLPDAEAVLGTLADKMRGAVAFDAKLVGIYSGGAWLAERLADMLDGDHPVGYIDVSFYRDDYA